MGGSGGGWDLTRNGFQEQIEGVGQRQAGLLALSLVTLASKHPLAFSKVELMTVFVCVLEKVVGNRVQDPVPIC